MTDDSAGPWTHYIDFNPPPPSPPSPLPASSLRRLVVLSSSAADLAGPRGGPVAAVQLRPGSDLERNHADPNIPVQSPHRGRQTRSRSEDPRGLAAGLSVGFGRGGGFAGLVLKKVCSCFISAYSWLGEPAGGREKVSSLTGWVGCEIAGLALNMIRFVFLLGSQG